MGIAAAIVLSRELAAMEVELVRDNVCRSVIIRVAWFGRVDPVRKLSCVAGSRVKSSVMVGNEVDDELQFWDSCVCSRSK